MKRPAHRFLLPLVLFAGLIISGGCSVLKIGYLQADFLGAMMVSRYLDLDATQSALLKLELKNLLSWHRSQEIPRYASKLDTWSRQALSPISPNQYDMVLAEADSAWKRLVQKTISPAGMLLPRLTDAQVAQLKQSFAKENQKLLDSSEDLPADERLQKRTDRWIERIEDTIGDLSPDQTGIIRSHVARMTEGGDLRYAWRLQRQEAFLSILEQRNQPQVMKEKLREWLLVRDTTSELGKINDNNRRVTRQLILSLDQTLTTSQRQRLSGTLASYRDLCEDLLP
ncbi:MAG: hypothetical protein HUU10_05045 [Bacteroidetes bacterium]|nr:hypothetical protein [Bacteroidota bacterium]